VRNEDEHIYQITKFNNLIKMKIEKTRKGIKELVDAVSKKETKKGFKPLTDDIYNITKDNRV